ncbi:MAG TPA: fatty acid desaturase [Rhizomicrobium sp.]|nr:fatty acid desaturase [Rhizomicrobium sp.]
MHDTIPINRPVPSSIVRSGPDRGNPTSGSASRARLETPSALFNDLVSRVVGKALPHQEPEFDLDGLQWWFVSTGTLGLLVFLLYALLMAASHSLLWALASLPAMPVLLIAVTGRFRTQQVTFAHHAVHHAVSKRWRKSNRWLAHITTAISLSQNPDEYRHDHVKIHHCKPKFTTEEDPDAAFLHQLGFRPGLGKRELYVLLAKTIVSPSYHLTFLNARFRSSLITCSPMHRRFVLAWMAILAVTAMSMPFWVFALSILAPLFPLYHISALLQFLTEHKWRVTKTGPSDSDDYASRCVGRFCLVTPPPRGLTGRQAAAAWAVWAIRMIPPLMFRLGVLVGDMPVHDHHHLVGYLSMEGGSRHELENWTIAVFERQRAINSGASLGLEERETYDVKSQLEWVFEGFGHAAM